MEDPDHVLGFWLEELEEKDWYVGGEALDARIRGRFADLWQQARAGRLDGWETSPRNVLAYLILTDQFPRNMWRGHADSFATDAVARTAAKRAIDLGWDTRIEGAARQFFYLPLMHSECLVDQDRCVRLIATRMPGADSSLLHAKAHREVIRRFGRFPYRNAALGRDSRAEEQAYLEGGGYGSTVEALKAAA
jgi:uncharacterized protein (DUF924 family)